MITCPGGHHDVIKDDVAALTDFIAFEQGMIDLFGSNSDLSDQLVWLQAVNNVRVANDCSARKIHDRLMDSSTDCVVESCAALSSQQLELKLLDCAVNYYLLSTRRTRRKPAGETGERRIAKVIPIPVRRSSAFGCTYELLCGQ
jgi:hypothetical protein